MAKQGLGDRDGLYRLTIDIISFKHRPSHKASWISTDRDRSFWSYLLDALNKKGVGIGLAQDYHLMIVRLRLCLQGWRTTAQPVQIIRVSFDIGRTIFLTKRQKSWTACQRTLINIGSPPKVFFFFDANQVGDCVLMRCPKIWLSAETLKPIDKRRKLKVLISIASGAWQGRCTWTLVPQQISGSPLLCAL